MIDDLGDATWDRELDDPFLRIGHRSDRADLRRRMRDYVRALLAHAFLAVPAAQAAAKGGRGNGSTLVPLIVAEVRRFLATGAAHRPRPPLRVHAMSEAVTSWRGGAVRPPLMGHQPTTFPTTPLTRTDSEKLLKY
ncbi:hypothetical protein STRCI_001056 [Streptomyces cinnabarinus]|uniref:Uncharacterized protein n=1 Tax=Streptomyces cinnabarinus TaxID=67287 RepID=A0ABY7K8U1_9ACTN|nr:hypothetical protein [Streptomyces cinnabarinus]WAZ19968.1 hypothetical protein STRCI_001056 [Streptomyces cinnabarinus]